MANPEEIAKALETEFKDAVLDSNVKNSKFPHVVVEVSRLNDICKFLLNDDHMAFDFLSAIAGVDKGDEFEVVYIIHSYLRNHSFAIKTRVPRSGPRVPSVCDLWAAANWHERETYDLMGIIFEGHPDLRRILLPQDWEGHPLRKDYKYPKSYDGIELRRDDDNWPDPGDKELYE